jgi:hypothetical protein
MSPSPPCPLIQNEHPDNIVVDRYTTHMNAHTHTHSTLIHTHKKRLSRQPMDPRPAPRRGDKIVPDQFPLVGHALHACPDGGRVFVRKGNHTVSGGALCVRMCVCVCMCMYVCIYVWKNGYLYGKVSSRGFCMYTYMVGLFVREKENMVQSANDPEIARIESHKTAFNGF